MLCRLGKALQERSLAGQLGVLELCAVADEESLGLEQAAPATGPAEGVRESDRAARTRA